MTYLLVFLGSLVVALAGTWCVRNVANARGWIHEPKSDRHIHTMPGPRLGGIAIYFSFMSVVIAAMVIPRLMGSGWPLNGRAMAGLLGPGALALLLGLWDDVRPLSARWKLAMQTVAAVWLYAGGYGVHNLGLIHGGQTLEGMDCFPLTGLWGWLVKNAV